MRTGCKTRLSYRWHTITENWRKMLAWCSWIEGGLSSQVRELWYLGILLLGDGKVECEVYKLIGARWRDIWAKSQSFHFTSPSTLQPSPMVMRLSNDWKHKVMLPVITKLPASMWQRVTGLGLSPAHNRLLCVFPCQGGLGIWCPMMPPACLL